MGISTRGSPGLGQLLSPRGPLRGPSPRGSAGEGATSVTSARSRGPNRGARASRSPGKAQVQALRRAESRSTRVEAACPYGLNRACVLPDAQGKRRAAHIPNTRVPISSCPIHTQSSARPAQTPAIWVSSPSLSPSASQLHYAVVNFTTTSKLSLTCAYTQIRSDRSEVVPLSFEFI